MIRRQRILARLMLFLAAILALLILSIAAFIWLSPQFGARPSPAQHTRYAATGHYSDGKFVNQLPTDMTMSLRKTAPLMYRYFTTPVQDKSPSGPLPMLRPDPLALAQRDTSIERLTWFGHSACLLETRGRKILFDPMFGDSPAPLPFLAAHRFNTDLPILPEALPRLDAVVISHDHYDHLDYGSILKLKDKTDLFLVPLGVGAHLLRWGVEPDRIRELDWGDSASQAGFTFVCAPARHFSGRGLRDGSSTLWASWIVKTGRKRIYFSGDSGYGPHFQAIGAAHGPFDLVLMECGQYNADWSEIHMVPADAVKAVQELGGRLMIPIHWGAFALSLHAWYAPIREVTAEARARNVRIAAPELGEAVYLDRDSVPDRQWWP
jgi:L-ascorbate metabolism protein UlaG (beta-lactamase superfamily)